MENRQTSNGRKAMEEELIKGRDIANKLLEILVHDRGGVEVESGLVMPLAEDLVHKVLRSFTNTLLLLNTYIDLSHEIVMPITTQDVSLSVKSPKPEVKDEACKLGFFKAKRGRGCYKRNAATWEKNSSILMEDGYVWRKYGQKMTKNSKYLRSYYRCTHKYDEGCPAFKQVQRIQENPPLYRTTYYGHHNCKNSLISSEIMLEPPSNSCNSSMFLNFNNSLPRKEEYSFSSSISSSTKKEPVEVIPDDFIVHNELPSSDAYLLLCDYEDNFNYSRQVTVLSSAESVQFDDGSNLDFDG